MTIRSVTISITLSAAGVKETLNAMLDAEAERLCNAADESAGDTPAGSYSCRRRRAW
jgi:hypothetical protein